MAKVKCGTCENCGPKKKAEVQSKEYVVVGKTNGDDDRLDLVPAKGEKKEEGGYRSCPDWAVIEEPPEEPAKAEPKNLPTWVEKDTYGLKCRDCGSRRGEDHCASCPNYGKGIGC